MTIDCLDVDLRGVFEAGMTYVALSRGVSADRIKLRNFSLRGVLVSPKSPSPRPLTPRVLQFYRAALAAPPPAVPPPRRTPRGEAAPADSRGKLPCSPALRRPFAPPAKRPRTDGEADLEGWRALYARPFEKAAAERPRGRMHTEMLRQAEDARGREEPQLPAENAENALLFKRMAARRQLLGGLL